jgi:tripartite-type tricarboxylate transporter receptor subunit TctC
MGAGDAMKLPRRRFLHLAAGAAALPVFPRTASADDYPTRTITIIGPFGISSVPDVLLRIVAPHLSKLLGQPVVVENVIGAGGMLGMSRRRQSVSADISIASVDIISVPYSPAQRANLTA